MLAAILYIMVLFKYIHGEMRLINNLYYLNDLLLNENLDLFFFKILYFMLIQALNLIYVLNSI